MPRQLSAYDRSREKGGRVIALTMPVLVPMNMNFLTFCAIWLLPGWQDTLGVDVPERIELLKDPEVRARLLAASQSQEAGVYRRVADWDDYVIGDTFSAENEGLSNRVVKDIAAERGTEPFDTLLDIVIADDLRTILWPAPTDKTPLDWAMRTDVWNDPRAMIGGSDAGAHLDRMCGRDLPHPVPRRHAPRPQARPHRERRAPHHPGPAELFGLRDRGTLEIGKRADIAVIDPETVGSEPARMVADLPGGCERLTAGSFGVERVLVNGTTVIEKGEPTGATPGTLLRSGLDTYTVEA